MRDFKLFVPSDSLVSKLEAENEYALQQMEKVLKADTRPAAELNLGSLSQIGEAL